MINIYHGEHVAGVGGSLLAARSLVLVVEDPRHRQAEIGSENVNEDCVTRVHCLEVVPPYDLIDDEDDGLQHCHHHQLDGRGHS